MKVWKRLRQIAAAALMLLANERLCRCSRPYYRAGENLPPPESLLHLRVGDQRSQLRHADLDRTPFWIPQDCPDRKLSLRQGL